MTNQQGWVKLHRQMLDSSFHNKPSYVSLWVTLLLMANHKTTKFMWNGEETEVKSGQIITGRKALSEQTGIAESTIEDILKVLKRQHQIQQQTTTKYRLITILNWDTYQSSDSTSNNKATTKQQQTDTYKNDKNEKKDIYIADKSANDNKLQDLYNNFGFPKKSKTVNQWQDEASNAISYLKDSKGKESSIFRCYKDNQSKARIALSDCKELGKPHTMYFFKIYNEIKN